jgi:hypothetical protein
MLLKNRSKVFNQPDIATTEVFMLAENLLSIGKIQEIITGQLRE